MVGSEHGPHVLRLGPLARVHDHLHLVVRLGPLEPLALALGHLAVAGRPAEPDGGHAALVLHRRLQLGHGLVVLVVLRGGRAEPVASDAQVLDREVDVAHRGGFSLDTADEHVAVELHAVEAAVPGETDGPGVGREALEHANLVEVEVDAGVSVGGGGADERECLRGSLRAGVLERGASEGHAVLAELPDGLLARHPLVDRTAADEPVLHGGGELIARGVVREDHLELLEGFGVIRGDADVLDAARDALDVIQRVSGGGGSLGLLLAILRGLDLDAVRAEPRLLLLGGVQLFILSDWGVVGGHPGLRFVAEGVCDAV